jgi:purine-binding chemotaxis protein CheW
MRDPEQRRWLLIESGGHACALPLANVRETMRPLPIEALANAPEFVLGLAVIRGASVPVVDLAAVLGGGGRGRDFGRFLTLSVDGRVVALAVDAVRGVGELDPETFEKLPPLLGEASGPLSALTLHDAELLLVLRAGRLFPEHAAFARSTKELV